MAGILLENEADVTLAHSGHGETPLFVAVRLGHVDVVEALIECGMEVDEFWQDGSRTDAREVTLLYIAAENGNAVLVGRGLHSSTVQLNLSLF